MLSKYIMGIIYGKLSMVLLYLIVVNNNYRILKHVNTFSNIFIFMIYFLHLLND